MKNLLWHSSSEYFRNGRRGKCMIYALVFLGYLMFMFLPLFIMFIIESYSVHTRAEKKHRRQLDKLQYNDEKRLYKE